MASNTSVISKPKISDLAEIKNILLQWTKEEDVAKYLKRIRDEIEGITQYKNQFWVIREQNRVVGIGGLADSLPRFKHFFKTQNPGEIKLLYVDNEARSKGVGKKLLNHLEERAKMAKYGELVARSNIRYKDTAYGFYEKMGYKNVGYLRGMDKKKVAAIFHKMLS